MKLPVSLLADTKGLGANGPNGGVMGSDGKMA
jgi:hypothetical protein